MKSTNRRGRRTVVVVGADGRMGKQVLGALAAADDLELTGTVVRGEALATKLADLQPDLAIDFTSPECVEEHVTLMLRARVCPVIGTTGLARNARDQLIEISRELRVGGIIAPNFSIGAVLMVELAGQLARHFATAEIVETHHPKKKDAPSGTALATRERIAAVHAGQAKASAGTTPSPIHSIRLAGFLARQEVVFGGAGERISVAHEAIDRECYMPGVLLACRRVCDLGELVVGLEKLLG